MTVSGRFGNATRPNAAQSKAGGGTIRRTLLSPPGVRSESPISTAGAVAEAAGEKEVEASAIRRRDARHAVAAPRHVAIRRAPS